MTNDMKIRARAILWGMLAIGILLACVFQLSGTSRSSSLLQTNLLAVLPPTERSPLAEDAVNRLANVAGNRAIFLVGHASGEAAAVTARSFADHLRQTNTFKQVISDIPSINPKQLTDLYLQHRFHLLSDADRIALAAGNADLETRLLRKLHAPFRFGLSLSPADDPFGFTDAWIASLPLQSLKLQPENGLLMTRAGDKVWVLVTAELSGSAYDSAVQGAVIHATAEAESALHQQFRDVDILRTGTVFYADAARTRAEHEVNLFGVVTIIGVLLMLYLVFRSVRPLALGLLSVGFGLGAAFTVTVFIYGELHLITLVFGASLIGEAIDYAIQYFAAHLGAGSTWTPLDGLRRITPALILALTTSMLGYVTMMFSPFPVLSQIALFALVGLSTACLSVFLLLPALLVRPNQRDPNEAVALPRRFLVWWKARIGRRTCYVMSGALLCLSVPGWLQLSSNDDVRLLIARPPALMAQEEKIRDLIGFSNSNQFFLIEGATPDEVLSREESLRERLSTLEDQGVITGAQSLSRFVPSLSRQQANHDVWERQVFFNSKKLRDLFSSVGMHDHLAAQQLAAFHQMKNKKLLLEDWLASPLATPYRHLWLGKTTHGYASIVLPQGVRDATALHAAAEKRVGVSLVDKAGSVSKLFEQYRKWGALWIGGALCIVFAVLCVRYHWQGAAVVIMPTLLGMAASLGLLGYFHTPVTLFNIMGLMLVLGIGVNYAIFLREGGTHAPASLAGVLLSAATTLLSFGLLAFSSMPALSNFGIMLLVGIGVGVLCTPMVLCFESEESR